MTCSWSLCSVTEKKRPDLKHRTQVFNYAVQGDGRKKKTVSLNNEKEQQSWGGKGQNKLENWSVCEFFWLRKLRKWCSNKHKWKNNKIMVYTIWFIRHTQTQLCLPKSSTLISVSCKSKGRMWAQWEIHVGPLTRAELSTNNWACKRHCSGLHLLKAAKLLLIAAASSCQLSSETDQLPQINLYYLKPILSFFLRNREVSLPETVSIIATMSTSKHRKEFLVAMEVHIQCLEVVPTLCYLGTGHDTTLNSLCGVTSPKHSHVPWKSGKLHVFRGSQAGMFLSFPLFTFSDWSQF